MTALAGEMREALFNRLTKIGGHFGPNFGMVEATIALHYVFNSPMDKFVFDVSHQSYAHKLLTGRKAGYLDEAHFAEDSGYTNPEESEHDFFNVGHTSTSIALAVGLAKGRDVLGGKENIIAVIGDGSLSGGEALEALSVAGSELNSNFIIVVNDNEIAIAENHGGIYKNLKELRETNGKSANNMFRAFGLDYIYEENGNDIGAMIALFEKVKDIDHPIVLHIHTLKGKGYAFAEKNKETWHWTLPFDRATGKTTVNFGSGESYGAITPNWIMERAAKDKKFVVVTPAMPASVGLVPELREKLGTQYLDVGIAERFFSGARRAVENLISRNQNQDRMGFLLNRPIQHIQIFFRASRRENHKIRNICERRKPEDSQVSNVRKPVKRSVVHQHCDRQIVDANVLRNLVVGALQKSHICNQERISAVFCDSGANRSCSLLRNSNIKKTLRIVARKSVKPGSL